MCRFLAYLGSPVTLDTLLLAPQHSLVRQSYESEERSEPLNGDGFGVAWYDTEVTSAPARFRSITPAWSNQNLREIARAARSSCVFAHVRAASKGSSVSEMNCHPFISGRYSFMHNGGVEGFRGVRKEWIGRLTEESFGEILGSTDTEHIFAIFLDKLQQEQCHGMDALESALRRTIEDVLALASGEDSERATRLNLAVTDGTGIVASRFATDPDQAESLYTMSDHRSVECQDGALVMGREAACPSTLVCSEPLTADDGWAPVPANHIVRCDPGGRIELRPL